MTGSALMDFLITIIVLAGTGALFFVTIDRLAPDALLNQIGKIAVGVVLAVVLLLAVKGVLFGGGVALSAAGIIGFAIGIVVLLVVLFLVEKILDWLGPKIGPNIAGIIKYVVFAIALIALLAVADSTMFGGRYVGAGLRGLGGPSPSIMRPEHQ